MEEFDQELSKINDLHKEELKKEKERIENRIKD